MRSEPSSGSGAVKKRAVGLRKAVGKYAHSPTWHRRAKKTRSRARGRTRRLQERGLRPRARDQLRLALHHSSPFPVTLMGKPKDWRGNGGQQSWDAAKYRSWSIWPGAFSPQAPWRPKGGKGAAKDQGIPGYATGRATAGAAAVLHGSECWQCFGKGGPMRALYSYPRSSML